MASKEEMIHRASHIAIVQITEVQPASIKGAHWNYSQQGGAVLERVLKGKLPHRFVIYGGEDFVCARTPLRTGRFLVFLKQDTVNREIQSPGLSRAFYVGANWGLSLRPIRGSQVEWYSENNGWKQSWQPLEQAVTEIKVLAEE